MIGNYVGLSNGDINESIKAVQLKGGDCCMVCAQSPIRPSVNEKKFKSREKGLEGYPVVVHAPFSINLATDREDLEEFTIKVLEVECKHAESLDSEYLVVHPGSALKQDRELALQKVAERLMEVINRTPDSNVKILLETMAGKGSELGKTLEEIEKILEMCNYHERVGVCLDTCHLHDGGYELNEGLIDYIKDLGILDNIYCVHVNGSKNPRGSKKDRHIGIFSPENHIDKEVIYNFVKYFDERGVICVLEKELEYITNDIEFLKYHTGYIENYDNL